jgi:hypothetical protein
MRGRQVVRGSDVLRFVSTTEVVNQARLTAGLLVLKETLRLQSVPTLKQLAPFYSSVPELLAPGDKLDLENGRTERQKKELRGRRLTGYAGMSVSHEGHRLLSDSKGYRLSRQGTLRFLPKDSMAALALWFFDEPSPVRTMGALRSRCGDPACRALLPERTGAQGRPRAYCDDVCFRAKRAKDRRDSDQAKRLQNQS